MISSWTMTRRWAGILIAMMMIAVPASAAVITQNFMRADVSVNAACFTKTAGADASSGSGFLTFNGGATITDPTGTVDLIQETMSMQGFAGDRLIYTDAVRFNNDCPDAIAVTFVSENDPADGRAIDPDRRGYLSLHGDRGHTHRNPGSQRRLAGHDASGRRDGHRSDLYRQYPRWRQPGNGGSHRHRRWCHHNRHRHVALDIAGNAPVTGVQLSSSSARATDESSGPSIKNSRSTSYPRSR